MTHEFVTTANATTIQTDVADDDTFSIHVVGLHGDTSPYTMTVETTASAAEG